jgi:hypothetical protein
MSLIVGAEAYARETQRYRPLSFIHEIDEGVEQAWAAERRQG